MKLRSRIPLAWRLTFLIVMAVLAVMTVSGGVLGTWLNLTFRQDLEREASGITERLSVRLRDTVHRVDPEATMEAIGQELRSSLPGILWVDDPVMARLMDSPHWVLGFRMDVPGQLLPLPRDVIPEFRTPGTFLEQQQTIALPDEDIVSLHLAFNDEGLRTRQEYLFLILVLQSLAASVILAVVLLLEIHYTVQKPLDALTGRMQAFAVSQDLPETPAGHPSPEFRLLDVHFRRMARSLAHFNEHLETLVEARTVDLVETRRLQSWGSMHAASVAHEIRTPLGNANLALSSLADSEARIHRSLESGTLGRNELSEYLAHTASIHDIMSRELEKAIELANHFKDLTVDTLGSAVRDMDLVKYMGEILISLQNRIRKQGVTLVRQFPPLLPVHQDPGVFTHIVSNLILNCLNHAFPPPTGRVPSITVHLSEEPDGMVLLSVIDNGVGMPPEVREQIFTPLFTTARESGGSGLGLSLISTLVDKKLGGTIQVETEIGAGSAFHIRFRAGRPAVGQSAAPGM